MVIVGVVLIMAVLLDAWRRIRREKISRVRMKLVDPDDLAGEREVDISMFSELPNGGARVVKRNDILRAAGFESVEAGSSSAGGASGSSPDGQDDLVAGISTAGTRDPGCVTARSARRT